MWGSGITFKEMNRGVTVWWLYALQPQEAFLAQWTQTVNFWEWDVGMLCREEVEMLGVWDVGGQWKWKTEVGSDLWKL